MQEVENASSVSIPNDWRASFGEVDAILASANAIESSRRTAFQARLKHFLKLGALPNVKQGRGKAASYSVGDVITMAAICDLTRFGIAPESAVAIIENSEFILVMATYRSLDMLEINSDEYLDNKEFDSIMLYFYPNALSILAGTPQMASLFWGGADFLSTNGLDKTKDGQTRQVSVMNFTSLLRELVRALKDDRRDAFIEYTAQWAQAGIDKNPQQAIFPEYEVE